jgi:hypothetical protein
MSPRGAALSDLPRIFGQLRSSRGLIANRPIEEVRMPKLLVMDHTGHSEEAFDPNDILSLQEAERRFAELTARGFTAAKITGDGKNPIVRQFDPTAEQIVMIPRLQGG